MHLPRTSVSVDELICEGFERSRSQSGNLNSTAGFLNTFEFRPFATDDAKGVSRWHSTCE